MKIILTVKNLRLEVLFKQEELTNTGYKQIFLIKKNLNKKLGTNAFGKIKQNKFT
jgi:ribosomal protein L9